jgi:Cu/Zn superoxide dismutase
MPKTTSWGRVEGRAWPLLLAAPLVGAVLLGLSLLPGHDAEATAEPIVVSQANAGALTFGATLSGEAQPTPVETDAVGGFALEVAGGVATYTLALIGIDAVSQAHIHQGAAGTDGGVVAFLASHEPAADGDVWIEGALRTSDLIGALAADWDGFLADLGAGNLYVNVHTSANPGGELRGQLIADADATVSIAAAVPEGASLLGWFGLDTDSAAVLESQPALTAIWWLGPEGWILDAPVLPISFRSQIAIVRGTAIVVIAGEATTVQVPLASPGVELTAVLSAFEESGVSGLATLSAVGSGTRIRVAAQGLTEGPHSSHTHHGSCSDQGIVDLRGTESLVELDADDAGDAAATTIWAAHGLDHFATNHYVVIHRTNAANRTGHVIACGNVVGSPPPVVCVCAGHSMLVPGRSAGIHY